MIAQTVIISLLSIVSGIIGTVSGFGMGTVMTTVLIYFLPFSHIILLVGILHWFHGLWKLLFFRSGFNWPLILKFGIPSMIMTIVGASLAAESYQRMLAMLFSLFLIAYVCYLFCGPTVRIKANWRSALIGGGISGFFAGIFGVRGAVRSAFLTAYDLPKDVYLNLAGTVGILTDTTRVITYMMRGIELSASLWYGLIFFVPASFLGVYIGQHIVDRIPQQYFQHVIAASLFAFAVGYLLTLF